MAITDTMVLFTPVARASPLVHVFGSFGVRCGADLMIGLL